MQLIVLAVSCLLIAAYSPGFAAEDQVPKPSDPAVPVILLHGFGSDASIWRGAVRSLEAEGFAPIPVEWRPEKGWRTPQTAVFQVLPRIEDALEIRGYPEGQPFHLIGHSLGGLVARFLIERPDADVDHPQADGSWLGDGRPDGDPSLAQRVLSLVMLSTPNRGARTGIARAACELYRDPDWRPLGCDLGPRSPLIQYLGWTRPDSLGIPYLGIGVASHRGYFLVPAFEADGDGRASGHDNAVMAESVHMEGADFVIWRGRVQHDHFDVTCSAEVLSWVTRYLRTGEAPEKQDRKRRSGGQACSDLDKGEWLTKFRAEQRALQAQDLGEQGENPSALGQGTR